MRTSRWIGAALAALATMTSSAGQWQTGATLPELRLPDIRFPAKLEPDSEAAARARTVDLRMFRGQRLLLLEFASW